MTKTILDVSGMSCRSCVEHVKKALAIRGVRDAEVRLAEGKVAIEHEDELRPEVMISALRDAGYDAAIQLQARARVRRGCCGGC